MAWRLLGPPWELHVFEVFEDRPAPLRPENRHHVEPAGTMLYRVPHEEVLRGVFDAPPLIGTQRFVGGFGLVTGSRFYLHENQRVAVRANQVDFPDRAVVVASQHAKAATTQQPFRRPLTPPSESPRWITPAKPRAQPVQIPP